MLVELLGSLVLVLCVPRVMLVPSGLETGLLTPLGYRSQRQSSWPTCCDWRDCNILCSVSCEFYELQVRSCGETPSAEDNKAWCAACELVNGRCAHVQTLARNCVICWYRTDIDCFIALAEPPALSGHVPFPHFLQNFSISFSFFPALPRKPSSSIFSKKRPHLLCLTPCHLQC